MFFEGDRIVAVREMILADDEAGRRAALAKLLPMQRADFVELFAIMSGLPVTIRLLDPPLHEFLPQPTRRSQEVADSHGRVGRQAEAPRPPSCTSSTRCSATAAAAWRSPIPEIAEMQARAIFEAAVEAGQATGEPVVPGDHDPAGHDQGGARPREGAHRRRWPRRSLKETGDTVDYQVGTMIELPRAALRADEIAETAEFFSFGTNDLTQTTFGISRDDAASFLGDLHVEGHPAGRSVRDARSGRRRRAGPDRGASAGARTRPGIKLGICGEHGGDPASIAFCQSVGLDYVSCSPFRVPIARLAAAQAALGEARPRARPRAGSRNGCRSRAWRPPRRPSAPRRRARPRAGSRTVADVSDEIPRSHNASAIGTVSVKTVRVERRQDPSGRNDPHGVCRTRSRAKAPGRKRARPRSSGCGSSSRAGSRAFPFQLMYRPANVITRA